MRFLVVGWVERSETQQLQLRRRQVDMRIIPDNPLEVIRQCIGSRKIFWTYHVNMRMEERSVTKEMILSSVDEMEIIEAYPDDKYFSSYLLLSCYGKICYHVLIGADVAGDNVRIITAYWPNPNKWEPDFKIRREKL